MDRKAIYTIILLLVITAHSLIDERESLKRHQEVMQKLESISDPCQQIHGLSTVESRDFKPQYNRKRAKQVVSTCGESNK